jgi:hypothetical protein
LGKWIGPYKYLPGEEGYTSTQARAFDLDSSVTYMRSDKDADGARTTTFKTVAEGLSSAKSVAFN